MQLRISFEKFEELCLSLLFLQWPSDTFWLDKSDFCDFGLAKLYQAASVVFADHSLDLGVVEVADFLGKMEAWLEFEEFFYGQVEFDPFESELTHLTFPTDYFIPHEELNV